MKADIENEIKIDDHEPIPMWNISIRPTGNIEQPHIIVDDLRPLNVILN